MTIPLKSNISQSLKAYIQILNPILKLKSEASERYLKAMKAKKGYKVEEA